MKSPRIHPLLVIPALLYCLAYMALAERTITVQWDRQADATQFRVYVNGTLREDIDTAELAADSSPTATLTIPDEEVTVSVTAHNVFGESLPASIQVPTAPASPKGLKITTVIRTTIATPKP